jgi:hypothetical protein
LIKGSFLSDVMGPAIRAAMVNPNGSKGKMERNKGTKWQDF